MPEHLLILASSAPDQHVYNHPFLKVGDLWVWSGNMGNLVLSALVLILGGLWAASKIRTGPASQGTARFVTTNRFAHLVEVICVYLREEVVRPLLGDRTNRLMPILWTIFFFVLVNNLLGLIPIMDLLHLVNSDWRHEGRTPIGGTATQNLWVTGALAIIAGILFNVAALVRLGPVGYTKHLTADAPWFVWPIIVPIELAGQVLIKPVALAIRLFANMTAGHILLATLFLFVAQVWGRPLALQGPVTIISVLGAIAITFLELFVSFLQAFIFMFLTTVFISLMDHHDEHGHEHEHGHADGHEHAPAPTPRHA
ncbi:MAG: F0F1 ATP synthase subunit A [Phycisphaerales bacterium]|nr:F0F1 ATP synthase subunit A [Phycisphaerales bacterium]